MGPQKRTARVLPLRFSLQGAMGFAATAMCLATKSYRPVGMPTVAGRMRILMDILLHQPRASGGIKTALKTMECLLALAH
mmetsp:Transcript_1238/g.3568  ORF Transcript_1238/g.3568 Transcript_1238/m.3568 type:complete len:80 (-) Transcript_1238:183-422(-)